MTAQRLNNGTPRAGNPMSANTAVQAACQHKHLTPQHKQNSQHVPVSALAKHGACSSRTRAAAAAAAAARMLLQDCTPQWEFCLASDTCSSRLRRHTPCHACT